MSNCPKCGAEVTEEMSFCPKCGAPLKAAQVLTEPRFREYRRGEKSEKGEKTEKREKSEKAEKHELGFLGPLIGGLILIFLGIAAFIGVSYPHYDLRTLGASFLLLIGVIVIVVAIYGVFVMRKRHPRP